MAWCLEKRENRILNSVVATTAKQGLSRKAYFSKVGKIAFKVRQSALELGLKSIEYNCVQPAIGSPGALQRLRESCPPP